MYYLCNREEQMKQDTERYLMELEEEHTWLAYELRSRNAVRMRKEHEVRKLSKREAKHDKKRQMEIDMQQGVSYFRGEIINYKYVYLYIHSYYKSCYQYNRFVV
jgi:hypothetical protein